MARRAFYSFEYETDNWRASKIRNIGVVEGNEPASDNSWESVKRGGDVAIKRWIDDELSGRSCTIVLIGASTARRPWIDYEIEKSWNDGKGVLGIHIHRITDRLGQQCYKGDNPFSHFTMKSDGGSLDRFVRVYDPPFATSAEAYNYIAENLSDWIETAIKDRG